MLDFNCVVFFFHQRFERGKHVPKKETTDIYEKFDFSRRIRSARLPIEDYRHEILKTVEENPVTVLRGPTGCGKTTKVPQFILDDYRERGLFCNIVVAQPRRIAASTNASRVCGERGWNCGTIVGYQVGIYCSFFISFAVFTKNILK